MRECVKSEGGHVKLVKCEQDVVRRSHVPLRRWYVFQTPEICNKVCFSSHSSCYSAIATVLSLYMYKGFWCTLPSMTAVIQNMNIAG